MTYLALYREWRPRNFKEIVGQAHVTKTLTNALAQERIAHAYLFSGPRGTGKTTAAKVLAKAINCERRQGVEPCNECPSCVSIDQGNAMEVFEIDAASNRGIDEIRDLRENAKLSAAKGKYKIYIIDEVHMLTTEAFNALLKTLEEPPKQVVFILATTEVQKIPLTILSRVQRFEFQRISLPDIQTRLLEVCQTLNRSVDSAALRVIAQKAEGGLRDALSILDQCLVLEEQVGVEQVYQVLGMVGESFSSEIVDALIIEDYGQLLNLLGQGVNQGRDPRQILRELLDYLRQVLWHLTTGQNPLIEGPLQERFQVQSSKIELDRLLRWIESLLRGESQLKFASNARLAVELLLVQTLYDSQTLKQPENFGTLKTNHQPDKTQGRATKAKAVEPVVQTEEGAKDLAGEGSPARVGGVGEVTLEYVLLRWTEVLDRVWKLKKSTQAFLHESKPHDVTGNILTLQFRKGCSFHRDKVDQPENRVTIEQVLNELLGVKFSLRNIMEDEISNSPLSQTQEQAMVKKATDMFGTEMVVVKDE